GELLLGHVSSITGLLLTHDENHIITCDRDEHIRISRYPEGWDIERFCQGHTKYVSAIHITGADTSTLVSGGGDDSLYVWDYITGKLKFKIPILETVQPHVIVQGGRERRRARTRNYKPRIRPPEAKKGKTQEEGQGQASSAMDIDVEVGEKDGSTGEADKDGGEVEIVESTRAMIPSSDHMVEDVLVVSRIRSGMFSGREVILFSVLG
ncbi:uncharacterized protein EI90DRAFT_2942980, partial [Cantharellus anzutake]|uniref:uncharacterized protein n=1 Tax=Cantharellus anzutake TaxID=1750568 RepID=UPI001905AEC4